MFGAVLDTCVLWPSLQRDFNHRDFPTRFVPTGVHIIGAADFAANTCAVDPARALAAVQQISLRHRNPSRRVDEILDVLATRYKTDEAVDLMLSS